jgi:hypothetical protein
VDGLPFDDEVEREDVPMATKIETDWLVVGGGSAGCARRSSTA